MAACAIPFRPTSTPAPPTPTATPTATPEPLVVHISIASPKVPQGGMVIVKVQGRPGLEVSGSVGNSKLSFLAYPDGYWTPLGFSAEAPPGPRVVSISARDQKGRVAQDTETFTVVTKSFPIEYITLPPGQAAYLEPSLVVQEQNFIQETTQNIVPEMLWQGPFTMPVQGETSSPFGIRRSYNGGPPGDYHKGLDIAAAEGTPVSAPQGGEVVFAGPLKVRGQALILHHGMGLYTGFYHLSEIAVKAGQKVALGQILGKVGATGLATGPHLHWDAFLSGVNIDPIELLSKRIP